MAMLLSSLIRLRPATAIGVSGKFEKLTFPHAAAIAEAREHVV
jgi:hypothetical protein